MLAPFFLPFGGADVERTKHIGVKVPMRLVERIQEIARRENNGISAVCRRLLTVAVEREETTQTASAKALVLR